MNAEQKILSLLYSRPGWWARKAIAEKTNCHQRDLDKLVKAKKIDQETTHANGLEYRLTQAQRVIINAQRGTIGGTGNG
jgi:hypothetical protein